MRALQELLGVLSIASALLVLVLIWMTARPVGRRTTPTSTWNAERRVAVRRPVRLEPEKEGPPEKGSEAVEVKEEAAEERPATQQPSPVEGEARQRGSEAQEVVADAGQRETEGSGDDLEEELERELSETLSLYRQLLEELSKLKSGGRSQ
ncbi:MAG: hypothetical protein QXP81_08810 [Nitrososphaerota archaeon]